MLIQLLHFLQQLPPMASLINLTLQRFLRLAAFAEAECHAGDVYGAGEAHLAAHALGQVAEADVLDGFAELLGDSGDGIAGVAVL